MAVEERRIHRAPQTSSCAVGADLWSQGRDWNRGRRTGVPHFEALKALHGMDCDAAGFGRGWCILRSAGRGRASTEFLAGSAGLVGAEGDVEQREELAVQRGEVGIDDGQGLALVDDVGAGQGLEDLEHASGGRGGAGTLLVVEGQLVDASSGHRGTQGAFDQRVYEQRGIQAERERVDALVAVELDRGGVEDTFEGVVAPLEVGLALVGGQQRGRAHVAVVGDQRERTVGGGVEGDRVSVDVPGDGV